MEALEYLESERKKLWEAIVSLRDNIATLENHLLPTSPEDEEKAIRSLSIKAARAYNTLTRRTQEIETEFQKVVDILKSAKETLPDVSACRAHLDEDSKAIEETISSLREFHSESESLKEALSKQMESLQGTADRMSAQATQLQEVEGQVMSLLETVKTQSEASGRKYEEISSAHKSILGYVDSNGARVEGKKHDLDTAYDKLLSDMRSLKEDWEKYVAKVSKENADFLLSAQSDEKIIVEKLKSLLPDCLTAGLSSAYQKAREKEEKAQLHGLWFFASIIVVMLLIAAIPAALGLYLRFRCNWNVQDIVMAFPRFVLGALTFYFPLVWIAVFVNRRINLSKRLVEEYKHKEVVSKTFEGLSTQILKMDDEKTSQDLLAKLLYSTVSLNEKNPGELMKNFNRADNPLMDVLEQGSKMAGLIDKLATVPGMSRLFNVVERRREQLNKLKDAAEVAATSVDQVG